MLAIFDIDGTICDTTEVDEQCFTEALRITLKGSFPRRLWESYKDVTSSGIVREILISHPDAESLEDEIEKTFLKLLQQAHQENIKAFQPILGAPQFLHQLIKSEFCDAAIATGCFRTEANFKLNCVGISLNSFPHATSSDEQSRSKIIELAAKRAGFRLNDCIYFGDASWDVQATSQLNIPMIGIGRKAEQLAELGVSHCFENYENPELILSALKTYKK
ncbi:MAG: HAD family phosphatase [Verrucomicrobiota bacterium]